MLESGMAHKVQPATLPALPDCQQTAGAAPERRALAENNARCPVVKRLRKAAQAKVGPAPPGLPLMACWICGSDAATLGGGAACLRQTGRDWRLVPRSRWLQTQGRFRVATWHAIFPACVARLSQCSDISSQSNFIGVVVAHMARARQPAAVAIALCPIHTHRLST